MSGISNDMNPLGGNVATPGQQADDVDLGKRRISPEQEEQETADATVVEISNSASNSAHVNNADVEAPADADAATALANDVAAQISGTAEQAAAAHGEISPAMALKLTQP